MVRPSRGRPEWYHGPHPPACTCVDCEQQRRNRPGPSQPEKPRANEPLGGATQPANTAQPSQPEKQGCGGWGCWVAVLTLIALGVAGAAIWLYVFDGINSVDLPWVAPAGGEPPVSDAELDAMIPAPTLTGVSLRPTPTQTTAAVKWTIPFIEPGSINKANRYEHQNAVNWTTKPVIENGYLVAAGSTKNRTRLALNPPGGFATFVLKRRNTNTDLFAIVEPPSGGELYTGYQNYIFADTWDVSPTQFLIKVPASKIKEPADLLVWGTSMFIPLAIHSVYVAE